MRGLRLTRTGSKSLDLTVTLTPSGVSSRARYVRGRKAATGRYTSRDWGWKIGMGASLSEGSFDILGLGGGAEGLSLGSVAALEEISDIPVAGAGHRHVSPGSDFEEVRAIAVDGGVKGASEVVRFGHQSAFNAKGLCQQSEIG